MGDNAKDPVDHVRTTRPHAGESMKDTANMPGLVAIGVALVLFVSSLAAFGSGHPPVGIVLVALAAVIALIGGGWLYFEHRRVRRIEDRWHAEHPDAVRQRPSS
jgi:hypothetical protein